MDGTGNSKDHSFNPASISHTEMELEDDDDAVLQKLPEVPVVTKKKLTLDELFEVIHQLRTTQQRQEKKIKRLESFSNKVKFIFRKEWKAKIEEWKKWRALQKEEVELEGTLEVLQKTVRDIAGKEDEIQNLKERLAKLEELRELGPLNTIEGHGKEVAKSERKDAVAIFPEEIWKMILGNVSDSNDLWNCYNTCPLFEELLHDWKTSWVFKQTLPYFYRYLPGQALLKCRTICSGWLNVVDNLLGDHSSLRPYIDHPGPDPRKLEFVNPLKETGVGWRNVFTFTSDGNVPLYENPDIQDFPCRNVFVGRNVIMNIGREDGNEDGGGQQLWDRVNTFLTTFGQQIWYLTVSFPHEGGDEQFEGDIALQKVIQFLTIDLFRLAPNLRKLSIDLTPQINFELPWQQTFPPAVNLETIDVMFDTGDVPSPILTILLNRHHTQLRRLHLSADEWQDVSTLGWPNLSELYIEDLDHLEDYDSLGLQEERIPKLRKLGFKMSAGNLDEYVFFLTNLHQVTSTTQLSTLRLQLDFWGDTDDEADFNRFFSTLEENSDPNLFVSPTLKTIEIDHDAMGIWARSYNFLLRYFPLIENLHVFQRRTEDVHGKQFMTEIDMEVQPLERKATKYRSFKSGEEMVEINKYAYEEEMYKSNIWELFPRLKVFTFQWDVYTRGGYEAYLEALETKAYPKMKPK